MNTRHGSPGRDDSVGSLLSELACEPRGQQRRRRTQHDGFSLLEVILVVGLTAVIVTIVAGAIDFHLRQLTVRKTRIDEAQVARAILRQIADDLRSVVVDRPIDFSAIQNATQNAAGAVAGAAGVGGSTDATSGGATTGGATTGTTGGATTGGATTGGATTGGASTSGSAGASTSTATGSDSATATGDATVTEMPPGIYGTTYEIQIDVSRVPRYEEYAVIDEYAQSGMIRMLSDVKTVTYFVTDARVSGGDPTVGELSTGPSFGGRSQADDPYGISGSIGLPPDTPIAGLARRVNDRAEVRYATATGDDSKMNQRAELIAPEVAFVEFSYFDGTQWQTEWDMQEMGGIPLAVEVNLFLGTQEEYEANRGTQDNSASTSNATSYDPEHWYHMVVYLPISEALPTDASTTDGSAASASGSTSTGSSTGGASSGGVQ